MAAFLLKTTLHPQGKHHSRKETKMNLTTIGEITNNNWKRVTTHSIAATAGVALALSAVVALGPSGSASNVAPGRQASAPPPWRSAARPG